MKNQNNMISLRKMRWNLFLLGFFKIPLLGFVRPSLIEINENTVKIKIKLNRRSKNHLKSMYFGALAIGADLAGGIHAFYFAEKLGIKVSFAFKGMNADFIKRAESDVIFTSNDGGLVKRAILESQLSGERINTSISVSATDMKNEIVSTFTMIVSVKVKGN